jgi:AraC-like DNA-binding protein
MSRNAYITKFKRVTGQAPAKFLRRHRVDMAKQMLTETTLTEAEIAVAVGFTDTSHLIKVFLNELGVPPSSFRRREN